MKTWKIPVVWSCWSMMEIEADSLEEALKKAAADEAPLPDPSESYYLEDSFEIDHGDDVEYIREVWNAGQEDE